jgi:CheY-specific phosphatase CheX
VFPQLDEQSVIKANNQFWEQMLAMQLQPILPPEHFCVESGHVMGSVELSGAWNGQIEVRLAPALAYEATAAMMMQSPETVIESDVLDAIKEIANMIAGTIKSSLPRPCSMTVPAAAIETIACCHEQPSESTLFVAFRHSSGGLIVRIREHDLP